MIEDQLYLHPALDRAIFRRAVERIAGTQIDSDDVG